MTKKLKVQFPSKCIGCEMCIFAVQRQLEKAGLEGALIRVLRKVPSTNEDSGSVFPTNQQEIDQPVKTSVSNLSTDLKNAKIIYSIDLDPRINSFDIEEIKKICPTGVFEIVESSDSDGFNN